MAMVPDSECRTPTLMVLALAQAATERQREGGTQRERMDE